MSVESAMHSLTVRVRSLRATLGPRESIGGKRINRGGGLGLEIPVIYELYGETGLADQQ